MKRHNQRGTALLFALILVLVLSVMAASLMFLAQSETWGSMNYRFMTQARYGAEAGVNSAANYLMYGGYQPPNTAATLATYTTSPTSRYMQYNGADVVLSSNAAQSNYGDAAAIAGFAANVPNPKTLNVGNGQVGYTATAKLLDMQQVTNIYGGGPPVTVQTWELTGDGTINSVRNAEVAVTAILERQVNPHFKYGIYGQGNGCGTLTFSGGASTDSYDSAVAVAPGGSPTTQNFFGNVGSNGNLNQNGTPTTINGSMSTPRTGVGNCASGAVDAWTNNGGATVTGGLNQLPQPITYTTPTVPPGGSGNLQLNNGDCGSTPGCTGKRGVYTLQPYTTAQQYTYGDISLQAGAQLTLTSGIYNINSLQMSGGAQIILSPTGTPPQPIILNITGNGQTTVLDLTGGTVINTNNSFDSSIFQINYAGSGTVALAGGATAVGLVNAPLASVTLNSANGAWYGAIIANTFKEQGGTHFHYDRRLQKKYFDVSNYMLDSFTWSRF